MSIKEPLLTTVKRLFALSRNSCAFPECELPVVEDCGTITGIICHIAARNKGGPRYDPAMSPAERHAFENLILLCGRHSKIVDSDPQKYSTDSLLDMKAKHEIGGYIELSQRDATNAQRLLADYRSIYVSAGRDAIVNSPGAIQAQNVTIKNQKKTVKILPPEDSIGANTSKRNYIKHLIDRYNDFASKQPGRIFRFAAIYADITRRFGGRWDLVRNEKFGTLAAFLQNKIDRTRLGSINRGKGIPNYSSFSQFRVKYDDPV